MESYHMILGRHISSLGAFRHSLGSWLELRGLPAEARDPIVLATHEAAANAIQHARPDSEILVEAHIDDDRVGIVVSNEGAWAEPQSDDIERGKGLTLIKALMSQCEIRSEHERTTVLMQRTL